MKRLLFILIIFNLQYSIHCQNLVPNPSFEEYDSCPTGIGNSIYDAVAEAQPWYNPTSATPNYLNMCNGTVPNNLFGSQQARTGVAYMGFYVYNPGSIIWREYIQAPLDTPLIAGQEYCVEIYVNLAGDDRRYATDDIGVYFSDTAVSNAPDCGGGNTNCGPLPYTPQVNNPDGNFITDTSNWVLISGIFTAAGGESYITIGNFKDSANTDIILVQASGSNTIYYYIDDISLTRIPNVTITGDTSLCQGDSAVLIASGGANYQWNTGATTDFITVSPDTTTTYYVYSFDSCGADIVSDTASMIVNVEDCDTPVSVTPTFFIPNSFSPNEDGDNDVLLIRGTGIKSIRLFIYNRWGEKVFELSDNTHQMTPSHQMSTDGWNGTFKGKPLNIAVFA